MSRSGIALFLLAGFSLALAGCSQGSAGSDGPATYKPRIKPTEVEVTATRYEPIQTDIKFTGNLLPRRITRVGSDVEGVVAAVPQVGATIDVVVDGKHYSEQLGITYGQSVKKGDLLVQLDTSEEEVALQIAQAKLQKATADLAHVEAWERPEEVHRLSALRDEALARLEQSKQHYQRMEQLHQRKAISSSEFEKAASDVATAQATVAAAEAMLAQAQAGPTQEEINIQKALVAQAAAEVKQRELEIQKAQIRAPYDGVVTAFQVEVGDRVSPNGDPVAEIMDLQFLIAEIAVPEAYISKVHVHDRATVEAAGADKPITGLVVAVNDMVDPKTRTFCVRIAIDNEQRQYKAGQFATVHLAFGDQQTDRLAIPSRAIVLVEGTPHVFKVNGNQVETTPIELGLANDAMTEVVKGLSSGDLIVVDDPSLLADEMLISIKNSVADVASR
ncbi:efflux RND transporter periplasmic adaptor subunit [Blastopirellula marina]|uniref:Uncharacterized protein n=1 Tax=Blastopirellula marina TaxID=124 RepID=A0A2S8F6R4_9BACT|nr:efflux RND transporter periplasmic adaptor subunit [Blastopirellula marina]PQO27851.1 hypothetical protein C5Y98_26340 [Blastopirellula marina]PTL41586.1 efflux RND transporter periplasmic adaptor subunit [Blastopirellula marina]